MNRADQERTSTWHHNVPPDAMVAGGNEDLGKYLDIDFSNFESLDDGQPSGLDTPMDRLAFEHFEVPMMGNPHDSMQMEIQMSQNGIVHMSQQQNPYMLHGYSIPPTPVSSEMAAKYSQAYDHPGHLAYNRYPDAFTPLVSPAQTPLDSTFSIPEYGNGEFFSPLTSPAIEAQRNRSAATTASPVDMSASSPALKLSSNPMARRSRRRPSTSKGPPARSVKQSPAMKPQTPKRPSSLATLPSELVDDMVSEHQAKELLAHRSAQGKGTGNSDSSVSPEPLSESLMPPPALPTPSTRSPALAANSQNMPSNEPATPATLMKLPSNNSQPGSTPSTGHGGVDGDEPMEDMMLPESAAMARPVLTPIDTARSRRDDPTAHAIPAKSAKLSAASTPRASAMTPQILSPVAPGMTKPARTESRSGVRGKKRQGTASATISPALRPKISPNITPLMPATGAQFPPLTAEGTALYLASKSNYQNIIEGTHLPGVTYPETLAENLSSKRTSHKIAEQGRRNRINNALKEIESLIPASILANGKKERSNSTDEGDGDKAFSAGQGASKASTVEMAIVYIKNLQAELKVTKERLEAAERRIAQDQSSGSQSSD